MKNRVGLGMKGRELPVEGRMESREILDGGNVRSLQVNKAIP